MFYEVKEECPNVAFFGTRLGTQVHDFSACYFGGARSKGFATLSNVSKVFPNVSKLLRNQFQISSSPLIYSYSYLFFWLEILTKVFDRKH